MKTLLVILFTLLLVAACVGPNKAQLDAEVDRLCAIDGGIRVYETVALPADKFNKWGEINFYKPTQKIEDTLGPEYIYQWDMHYYRKGDPFSQGAQEVVMKRDHIQVFQRSSVKLLGELIMYHRVGGDLPGPWMPSSYHCPDKSVAREFILLNRIFVKSMVKKEK
ncbi:hypothetical protein W03_19600 [Nitrosomonas sp. PY1]|uniref:hypothetical protein n=1 Tax=Nitrosomonas sp. PY1 TaxID=1803906 RepID=UPI001FC8C2EB|nr:hypothetical protein [Nitrosomonas sp. PY1]GKS69956.1 hypothetical protein W03_19600 [Nitrosomonas sp. PY1]